MKQQLSESTSPKEHREKISDRKKISELLEKSLEYVRNLDKEEMANQLAQKPGYISKLRYNLFVKPLKTNLIISSSFLIFSIFSGLIIKAINIDLLTATYILLLMVSVVLLSLIPTITPKPDIRYDERWSKVVSSMLTLSRTTTIVTTNEEISIKELKAIIKRAIRSYRLDAGPFKFTLNLAWGGIFVGCLPDPKFQNSMMKAFQSIDFKIIWNENKFAAVCLMLIPILGIFYYSRYSLPKTWLEHVLFQIEVEE